MLSAPDGDTILYITARCGTVVTVSTRNGAQVTVTARRRAQERKSFAWSFGALRLTDDAGSSGFKFQRWKNWDERVLVFSGRRHQIKDKNSESYLLMLSPSHSVPITRIRVLTALSFPEKSLSPASESAQRLLSFFLSDCEPFWGLRAAAEFPDAAGSTRLEIAAASCWPCSCQIRTVRRVSIGIRALFLACSTRMEV